MKKPPATCAKRSRGDQFGTQKPPPKSRFLGTIFLDFGMANFRSKKTSTGDLWGPREPLWTPKCAQEAIK